MPSKRTGYAPWSVTREAGVQSATVDGTIEVPQYLQPVIDTGFVDEKGNWKGVKSSDEQFMGFTTHLAVPNTGITLSPDTDNFPRIDMTGFNDIFIAIKPSASGNYLIAAVMGPDTVGFANLKDINAAADLKGISGSRYDNVLTTSLSDGTESLTANVWNIYTIQDRLRNQKNVQIKVQNNTGGNSNIEFSFMRLV